MHDRRWMRHGLTVALLACAPAALRAQEACVPVVGNEMRRLVVGLEVDRQLPAALREDALNAAIMLADRVEAPRAPTMDKLRGPSEWVQANVAYRSEGLLSIGQLLLVLAPDGALVESKLDPGTGSAEVDAALRAATATAGAEAAFPPGAQGTKGNRSLRLWVVTAATAPASWATSLFPIAGEVPVGTESPKASNVAAPVYPVALRAKGITGDVVLRFSVERDGSVPEASVQVVSTDAPEFVEPARAALRQTTFTPGRVGGCTVQTTMTQRMRFRPPAGR